MDVQPEQFVSGPGGWDAARVSVASLLAFIGIYAYFELRYGSGLPAALALGLGTGLAGLAELLPTNRRWPAFALRLSDIGVFLALIGHSPFSLAT